MIAHAQQNMMCKGTVIRESAKFVCHKSGSGINMHAGIPPSPALL